jgi:hypothetical protein
MRRHVVTFLIAACLLTAGPRARGDDSYQKLYQQLADGLPWRWDGEHASLLYSVTQHLGYYRTEIVCPKLGEGCLPYDQLTVRILDDRGEEVYSFKAHRGTVFTRHGDVLYVAEFRPGDTGCGVAAYDIKAKKQLWRTGLQSFYKGFHSAYHNAVTMDYDGRALVIRGNEDMYRYIEYVDPETGKTLAHRDYPPER